MVRAYIGAKLMKQERAFTTRETEQEARDLTAKHLASEGYRQRQSMPCLVYERGSTIASVFSSSPKRWKVTATVQTAPNADGTTSVIATLDVDAPQQTASEWYEMELDRLSSAAKPIIRIKGVYFPLAHSVRDFLAAVESEGSCVLRSPTSMYAHLEAGLYGGLRERYGPESEEPLQALVHARLLCAGCLWEFPDTIKIALEDSARSLFEGGVAGGAHGLDRFGTTGDCPRCGQGSCLLVYQRFP